MTKEKSPTSGAAAQVTVRQVIAYNVRRARRQHGWDQAELCRRLRAEVGLTWSTTTLSAAEATWLGRSGRERHFDAVELVSLAMVLKIPISRLFDPPSHGPDGSPLEPHRTSITLTVDDDGHHWAVSPRDLRALSSGRPWPDLLVEGHAVEVKRRVGPDLDPRDVLAYLQAQLQPLTEGGEQPPTNREDTR